MKKQKKRFAIALFFIIFLGCVFTVSALASEGGGGKGWVSVDTYRVMNFGVLAVALFFILRKPLSQGLRARIDGIKEQLNDLEKKKRDAESELAEYEKKFANLDKEAIDITAAYLKQGREAKERILAEAKIVAVKMEETAKKNIEHEFKKTKKRLQKEIIAKSLTKARQLIKNKITTDDHNRLIDEYLTKVVA